MGFETSQPKGKPGSPTTECCVFMRIIPFGAEPISRKLRGESDAIHHKDRKRSVAREKPSRRSAFRRRASGRRQLAACTSEACTCLKCSDAPPSTVVTNERVEGQ
ncbi:unnamed protein product [Caenorhabditis auriculariae]|uniref:Uncharacterized protein n=1 Tax=Caenorhabditis auriculariae TaxID=2777116 RepID=A0A8S1H7N0_9PELO|nr:unnamed protein product [Caenorhabditis auriculariae]